MSIIPTVLSIKSLLLLFKNLLISIDNAILLSVRKRTSSPFWTSYTNSRTALVVSETTQFRIENLQCYEKM